MEYDFIVVGSGSVGAAAAYYAAQEGLRVLMIDSGTPPHREGSHHGSTRIIRYAYGEGEKYLPLVMRAKTLWHSLVQDPQEKLLEECGVLNIGPPDSDFIISARQSAERFDLNVQILSAAQAMQRWPGLRVPESYLGVFEADGGFLYSERVVKTFVGLAKEAGCTQLFNSPVRAVEPIEGGVAVVTDSGRFTAPKVAVTAGTWVKALLPELPVAPLRKIFSWYEAQERYNLSEGFPVFLAQDGLGGLFYGFPAENGALKLGKREGGEWMEAREERTPYGSYASDGTELEAFLRQFLPGVGERVRGDVCSYDMSPDGDFIIDTVPGCDRMMFVTGLSGHGFKFCSALGEVVSQFAQDRKPLVDVSCFGLKRFEQKA